MKYGHPLCYQYGFCSTADNRKVAWWGESKLRVEFLLQGVSVPLPPACFNGQPLLQTKLWQLSEEGHLGGESLSQR